MLRWWLLHAPLGSSLLVFALSGAMGRRLGALVVKPWPVEPHTTRTTRTARWPGNAVQLPRTASGLPLSSEIALRCLDVVALPSSTG